MLTTLRHSNGHESSADSMNDIGNDMLNYSSLVDVSSLFSQGFPEYSFLRDTPVDYLAQTSIQNDVSGSPLSDISPSHFHSISGSANGSSINSVSEPTESAMHSLPESPSLKNYLSYNDSNMVNARLMNNYQTPLRHHNIPELGKDMNYNLYMGHFDPASVKGHSDNGMVFTPGPLLTDLHNIKPASDCNSESPTKKMRFSGRSMSHSGVTKSLSQIPSPGSSSSLSHVKTKRSMSALHINGPPTKPTAWTDEEEIKLKALVDSGSKWPEIIKEFPYRSAGAIKKHFYADMKNVYWSEQDDLLLKKAIKEYKSCKWRTISERIGKPARSCERRFKQWKTRGDGTPFQTSALSSQSSSDSDLDILGA